MKKTVILLLFLTNTVLGFAQSVAGKIVSASDQTPLVGASITVKGTSDGTISDENGMFNLEVRNRQTLEISYIGFESKTYLVGNEKNITISLAESATGLNEIVVTALGIEKEKSSIWFFWFENDNQQQKHWTSSSKERNDHECS